MRLRAKTILRTAPLSTLVAVLTACGSSSPATDPAIVVKSPAFSTDHLPARYTCDGQNVSPPLEWGAAPAGVGQFALFLVGFTLNQATKSYEPSVEWAVAGLKPAIHRIAAGQLPAGAFLGLASDGQQQKYSICPAKGTKVHYQFEVYGVPGAVTVAPRFSGLSLIRALTGPTGPNRADAHGGFVANYTRP
jgi:phosphatidylethanolamine-binding protein (PEBP) family uncharacterized protein